MVLVIKHQFYMVSDFNSTEKQAKRYRPKVPAAVAAGIDAALVPAATADGTFGLNWTQGREFGTGSWHDSVPIREHRHRVVPPTGTK